MRTIHWLRWPFYVKVIPTYQPTSMVGNKLVIIGVRLSKFHIEWDNCPHAQNNGIYLSIYLSICLSVCLSVCLLFIPRLSHPGLRKIRIHHKMLCVIHYIHMLTCVIYNCMHSTEQQGQQATRCLPWRLLTKTDSAYWDGRAVAARQLQLSNAPVWIKIDQWADCTCCFVTVLST